VSVRFDAVLGFPCLVRCTMCIDLFCAMHFRTGDFAITFFRQPASFASPDVFAGSQAYSKQTCCSSVARSRSAARESKLAVSCHRPRGQKPTPSTATVRYLGEEVLPEREAKAVVGKCQPHGGRLSRGVLARGYKSRGHGGRESTRRR